MRKPDVRNPADLLLLIRDGANDMDALYKSFAIDPGATSADLILSENLSDLREAGLIEFDSLDTSRIKVSQQWFKIQSALQISLTGLARFARESSVVVTPYFGPPKDSNNKISDLFVVMPFREELQPVYEDHIVTVANTLKLTFKRADDFFGSHAVIHDIWNAIISSQIIIADCTNKNPNVFYEIGIAHTVGTPVILITQSADDVPFDLRHLRYILYSLTPRGMAVFEEALRKTLIHELDLLIPNPSN